MRINKKLFKKFHKNTYGGDKYIDTRYMGQFFSIVMLTLTGIALIALLVFWAYTSIQDSPEEIERRERICGVIAGDKPHYTAKDKTGDQECVVGPDWHRVGV